MHGRLLELEQLARRVLTYTAAGFPYFTPHDFAHSELVEENLNWIVPDSVKQGMQDSEIFFLLAAAWLHDWGMVCQPGETPDKVRDLHHVRTEENFEKMHSLLGLTLHEADIIGKIARGHRKEDLWDPMFDPRIYGSNIHVDVRFLAALVRLADECETTHNRIPELIYYSLDPQGASKEHFERILSIQGIGIDEEAPHKIRIEGTALDPKASQTLHKLRDKIQTEVDSVKTILAEHGIPIDYVELRVHARGFIDKPISFRLDQDRVTRLLIGEALYSRKDVAIRELLQNAVDACRLRKSIDPDATVYVRIYREGNHVVVRDQGIGMDYQIALDFLANKGYSYYESDEFKKLIEKGGFDPISRWGLGILSCFLIASEVMIDTKKEGQEPCKFIITSVSEGWRYEHGSLSDQGTVVDLTLNEEGLKINLDQTVRHYVKTSTIPIFLGKDSGEPLPLDWTPDDLDVRQITLRLDVPVRLSHEYEDDEIRIRIFSVERGREWMPALFLANQGFLVESLRKWEPKVRALPIPNAITLVNTKRAILDMDISREHARFKRKFVDKYFATLVSFADREYHKRYGARALSPLQRSAEYGRILEHFGIEFHLLPEQTESIDGLTDRYVDLIGSLTVVVLTTEGVRTLSWREVAQMKPVNIKVVQLMMHTVSVDQEILDIESRMRNRIQPYEIVQLADSSTTTSAPGAWQCIQRLFSPPAPTVQRLLWTEIFSEELTRVPTKLDYLLPEGSYFANLPKILRGLMITVSPSIVRRKMREDDTYYDFEMSDIYEIMLGVAEPSQYPGFEFLARGTMVFDAEDEFNKILAEAHDAIASSPALQSMVRNYFRLLAFANLGRDAPTYLKHVLASQEKEILELIPGDIALRTIQPPNVRWVLWREPLLMRYDRGSLLPDPVSFQEPLRKNTRPYAGA